MGRKQAHTSQPPTNVILSDSVVSLLKNVVPAVARADGRRNGVHIYSRALQEELTRLYGSGLYHLSVTAKIGDEIMTFEARIIKKRYGYVIYPLAETQKLLRQMYQQHRNPARRRNPLPVVILDLRPI